MNLVFIVGTGRCGSSLIHEVLARHEDVGFISNVEDNLPLLNLSGKWNNPLFRNLPSRWTAKGRIRFAPSEAYRLISRNVSTIYASPCRDLEADDVTPWLQGKFQNFFNERYVSQGKEFFIHKYTGWPRLGFFSKIFPEAKFIHVIRDGRAVANSWLQMPWWDGYRGPENWLWGALPQHYLDEWNAGAQSFPRLAAINWKLLIDSYERSGRPLGKDKYFLMRYEDFLENPHSTLRAAMQFCGLPWSSRFNKHFEKLALVSDRKNAYERDLAPTQLAEIESSLKDMLIRYGYLTSPSHLQAVQKNVQG
ncbi:MAG: sulfotransferase [Pseudomonadota bacterium]